MSVGYSGCRVGKLLQRHSEKASELAYQIIDHLYGVNVDKVQAVRAANELMLANAYLFQLGASLADGDIGAAEAAGKRMLGEEGKTL